MKVKYRLFGLKDTHGVALQLQETWRANQSIVCRETKVILMQFVLLRQGEFTAQKSLDITQSTVKLTHTGRQQ